MLTMLQLKNAYQAKRRTGSDWLVNRLWTNQTGQRKREQEAKVLLEAGNHGARPSSGEAKEEPPRAAWDER